MDKDAETLTLDVPNDLAVGETTLNIEYTGTHNDQMRGFYRSKYTAPNNPKEERYAAVTQFEAADARRALPCWDEPAHKASFDVVLIVPKDRVALSNMVRWHIHATEGFHFILNLFFSDDLEHAYIYCCSK